MSIDKVVIAGAGQAGFQAAASLRQEGFAGQILMLGNETALPYQRPPLSKTYLKDPHAARLPLRDPSFFEKNAIALRTGISLAAIDRHNRHVETAEGEQFPYDHLILALGARNRKLPFQGADLDGVHELRTVADAEALRLALHDARSVVVIGGGFIGLEVAATVAILGKPVTVVEATGRLMSRVVSPPISAFFLSAHRNAGVDLRLDALAKRIVGDRRAEAVELQDGTVLPADLVLVAAGVVPNAELAEAAGLYVHDGIRVGDMLETEDKAISAIGDCASFPYGPDGIYTRLESVQNAVDQGKCAARRLMGKPEIYRSLPWFWSDQGRYKLQIAGLTSGADHHVTRGSGEQRTVLCFHRDHLIGVETINMPGDHMAARRLLALDEPISLQAAEAAGFSLATLFEPLRNRPAPAA